MFSFRWINVHRCTNKDYCIPLFFLDPSSYLLWMLRTWDRCFTYNSVANSQPEAYAKFSSKKCARFIVSFFSCGTKKPVNSNFFACKMKFKQARCVALGCRICQLATLRLHACLSSPENSSQLKKKYLFFLPSSSSPSPFSKGSEFQDKLNFMADNPPLFLPSFLAALWSICVLCTCST